MNRGAYIIRRVLLLIPTLLAVYTLTFLLIHSTPGGPWSQGEKPVHPVVLERLNEAYGLNDPLWQQYVTYLGNAVQGDFGPSFAQRSRTVTDIISDTFPVSLALGIAAMTIALVVGVTLGTIGALKHNSAIDYVTSFVAIVGISTPSYVIVSLLVLVLSSQLGLLPTGGWDGIFSTKIIIPAIALSLYPAAVLARYTRASMLDVLSADYVRTARAKGLNERWVVIRHAIRNALIPVLTVSGVILADVITGSFFVETVYSVPGLGRYFVSSITERDYPVILGTVLLFGFVISVMNLIVDLLYPLLDPRIVSR
ncbi:MAG: ABC transporter permease [Chloroflexota bacterium]|jgi:oligopeptide transport system permease protein|nr:ABC transporter permease [Chloroflexia bacterium]MDQ3442822.1 ABC transporter permease [Chloroflexota bacterium]